MEQALIVRRWRRYGADRLYVTADTGAPLGSIDLVTGQVAVEPVGTEVEQAVRGAAQAYLRADLSELVVPAPAVLSRVADGPRRASRGRHRAADLPGPDSTDPADEVLGDRLDRLVLDGWHVLHDVPLGRQGSVVPHLLVGPPGVFAVAERPAGAAGAAGAERFALDGRHLSADGASVCDLRDLRLAVARVGSLLRAAVGSPVAVGGVLVLHGPLDTRAPAPADAIVVGPGALPALFRGLPAEWTTSRVDAVAAIARRRSTWAGH